MFGQATNMVHITLIKNRIICYSVDQANFAIAIIILYIACFNHSIVMYLVVCSLCQYELLSYLYKETVFQFVA